MTEIVSFSPETDATERQLGQWSASALGVLGQSSAHVVRHDRRGGAVQRSALPTDIASADLVLYFGHGHPDRLGGSAPLIEAAQEGPALTGRTVAGIACHAGAGLGPDLVHNHNGAGFLGFDDQLVVHMGNPAIFGAVVTDALRDLADPARGGADALDTLKDGFHDLRMNYQKVQKDPRKSKRARYDAQNIWLAAFPNEKTAVWIAPPSGGGTQAVTAGASDDDSAATVKVSGFRRGTTPEQRLLDAIFGRGPGTTRRRSMSAENAPGRRYGAGERDA